MIVKGFGEFKRVNEISLKYLYPKTAGFSQKQKVEMEELSSMAWCQVRRFEYFPSVSLLFLMPPINYSLVTLFIQGTKAGTLV